MQFRDFLNHKTALGRTEGTLEAIGNHLKCFWEFYRTKRKKLKTISKKDIEGYLIFLREKSYKPGTIQDRMNCLKDFLEYKGIKVFPAYKISRPKPLPKFLRYDEIKKIRECIKKERDRLIAKKEKDWLIFDIFSLPKMNARKLSALNCGDIKERFLLISGKKAKITEELYLQLKKFIKDRNSNEPLFVSEKNKRFPVFEIYRHINQRSQWDSLIAQKERNLLIVDLLYSTGMRTAELCSLNCGDLNNGTSLIITGKGNKQRMVLMSERLHRRLKKFTNGRGTNEPLFLSKGKRITRNGVSTFVKRYGNEAQLGFKVSPHKLRHSFATHLLNKGAKITTVSALLGHVNLATTQIYARLSNQTIKDEYLKYFTKCSEEVIGNE